RRFEPQQGHWRHYKPAASPGPRGTNRGGPALKQRDPVGTASRVRKATPGNHGDNVEIPLVIGSPIEIIRLLHDYECEESPGSHQEGGRSNISSIATANIWRIEKATGIPIPLTGQWFSACLPLNNSNPIVLVLSILKKVDQICRDFLWGSSADKKKVALVAWDKVCLSKRQGGLNIKGCSNWNKASVGQLLWQIIVNKESLWVKWVHGIYMKNDTSIWTHITPIGCSWYWRKINALKEHMQGWYNHRRYMLTQTGKYSITKSYQALMGTKPRWNIAELVWTSMAIPKHRFMTWLAVQGRLLT
ncbi:hypothetical protein MTR67_032010, partial [Solanum verrucosum]